MANKAVNNAIHKLQLTLLEGVETEKQLLAAGTLISENDYNDVVTERSIANICGYPLCSNPLPQTDSRQRKGKYRISLKEHKVYNVQEMYLYCSANCLVNSKAFCGSLKEDRSVVVNEKKIEEVLRVVGGVRVEDDAESKIVRLFSGLEVKENGNVEREVGEVAVSDGGASNAIEGYVPQHRPQPVLRKKGVNCKTNKPNNKKDLLFNEIDFTSVVITSDEYSISKAHCGSTKTTSKSNFELKEKDDENLEDQCAASGSLASVKDDSCMTSKVSTGKSKTVTKNEHNAQEVPSASVLPLTGSNISAVEAEREFQVDQESISGITMPKSSLKSSGSKKHSFSVTWADEKIAGCESGDLCEVRDMGDDGNDNNADDMLHFASAEACAMALSQAAEAVASGDSDVANAVSEAGIIILPCPHDGDEGESVEGPDVLEPEAVPLKWPSKPGIPRSDLFDPEDSWYDAPPEGFSLNLSPFATMWMAIFSWVSSSSLAYIYGMDESAHEEYISVNGREYSQKIIMRDGHSSEIKQTLSGCLARTFPGLVADLRLRIPVSTLEKGLEGLLNTMSFIDPLPAFRVKQWQVIAVLFLDALSVCRIPALTPHMTNRTMLVRKVLDVAQITVEEYEVMKDFVLPLGRAPNFSTQSGG